MLLVRALVTLGRTEIDFEKADPNKSLTLAEREEAQFQAALHASRSDQLPGQETGITGNGQRFGPAHGSYHDAHNWAMTPYNASAQEVADTPPPKRRQRKPEEPAFLRPSARTGYLPALLTIYHSIPLAREALLLPSVVKKPSYGHDPDWWSGSRIQLSRVVSYDDGIVNQGDSDDFVHETQRLIAFLDGTNRSYGSADALTEFECYRNTMYGSEIGRFLDTWATAAMRLCPDEQLTQIYNSLALKTTREQVVDKHFKCLEPNPRMDDETLYDTLDMAIWADQPNTPLDDVWIEQIAEVFTMRLYNAQPNPALRRDHVGVRIPTIWYPDRYLEEYRQISQAMRHQKLALGAEIYKIQGLQARCSQQPGPGGQLDIRAALLAAANAAELAVKDKSMPNGLQDELEPVMSGPSLISAGEGKDCARELRETVERIDKKLRSLGEQKERTLELYRKVAQQLTQPSENPSDPPNLKYTLRGVSTKPHITYVLRPAVQDLMDFEGDEAGAQTDDAQWQWWRISFSREETSQSQMYPTLGPPTEAEVQAVEALSINASGPYSDWSRKVQQPTPDTEDGSGFSIRKVRESEVLKAAREENNSVLLVYANENSINFKGSEVNPELKAFVEADNEAFATELRREAGEESQRGPISNENQGLVNEEDDDMMPIPTSPKRTTDGATSPTKRYKTFDGQSGMITPPEDEPPPYEAGDENLAQEMQEKSSGSSPLTRTTSRPNRIGQAAERMLAGIDEAEENIP